MTEWKKFPWYQRLNDSAPKNVFTELSEPKVISDDEYAGMEVMNEADRALRKLKRKNKENA